MFVNSDYINSSLTNISLAIQCYIPGLLIAFVTTFADDISNYNVIRNKHSL